MSNESFRPDRVQDLVSMNISDDAARAGAEVVREMLTQPSLTDFLLARLAEDEAVARSLLAAVDALSTEPREPWRVERGRLYLSRGMSLDLKPEMADHIAHHDPARVLAGVEAKRRIVERCAYATTDSFGGDYDLAPRYDLAWDILCDLASVYASHPDYRAEEWAP